jgi:hypothetical protein
LLCEDSSALLNCHIGSRSGPEHQIERRLRRAAGAWEPGFHDHISQPRLLLAWAPRAGPLYDKEAGTQIIVDAALKTLSTGFRLPSTRSLANGSTTIQVQFRASVMQTIEVGDEVVFLAGIVCGRRRYEGHVPRASFLGPFSCRQDRGLMVMDVG